MRIAWIVEIDENGKTRTGHHMAEIMESDVVTACGLFLEGRDVWKQAPDVTPFGTEFVLCPECAQRTIREWWEETH